MDDMAATEQDHGADPLKARETDHYQKEYVQSFVEKWDELIDWEARADSEGKFFIDILKARGKQDVLDVATGTGFHSVQLLKAGFDETSADGNTEMLAKAFKNGRDRNSLVWVWFESWPWAGTRCLGSIIVGVCGCSRGL